MLQVWLPLNGNLENKGLSNVTVTNNGATVDNNGKIGKCYKFNPDNSSSGQNYLLLNSNLSDILPTSGKSFSFACWIKLTGDLYSNGCGLIAANQYKATGVGVYINRSTKKIHIQMCYDGAEQEWTATKMTALQNNVWYHITYTYNETGKQMTVYVNGVNVDSTTANNVWVTRNEKISIGRGSQGGWGYTLPGFMNDVRIYDHCLSPKEVKEISKGLILHYPLNISNKNLFEKIPKSVSQNSYCAYQLNLTENLVEGQTYTIQFWNVDITGNRLWFLWGGGSIDLASFYDGTDFSNGHAEYLVKSFTITSTHTNNPNHNNAWLNIYNAPNSQSTKNMYIGAWKLEKGSIATPLCYGNENMIVPDASGYKNNGTITGNLSLSTDTPRYKHSTVLNGSNSVIKGTLNLCTDYIYTASFWIKLTSINSATQWIFAVGNNNNSNHQFGCYINSSAINIQVGGIVGQSNTSYSHTFVANTLYHIVITSDGTNVRVYINGTQFGSATAKNGTTTGTIFQIGQRPAAQGIYNYNGKLSDFRIYCTALSADDIKELYEASAFIDNQNNVLSYSLNETNNVSNIYKSGIVEMDNFIEDNIAAQIASNNEMKGNQFIEI